MSDDEYSDNDSLGTNDSVEDEDKKGIFSKNLSLKPNLPSFVKKTNLGTPILNEEDDEVEEEDDDAEEDPDFIGKNDILEEEEDDNDDETDDDDEDVEIDENGEENEYEIKKTKKNKKTNLINTNSNSNTLLEENIKKNNLLQEIDTDDDDENENDNDNYLQKFSSDINHNYLMTFHPESTIHNYDEIAVLTKIVRDKNGLIIDPLHRTASYLTKFEKARVLGQRAKQIECGAKPFIKVPENLIEGSMIAELELKEKKIPFIIRRPLSNGTCEYWNLRDLELL